MTISFHFLPDYLKHLSEDSLDHKDVSGKKLLCVILKVFTKNDFHKKVR